HEVREVDVPRVRRNVRALRHVADVAQVALVDDLAEVRLGDGVAFHRGAFVDEVEHRRECLAEAYATAAAMADVEHALELLLERGGVIELRVPPVERVAGWG